MQTEEELRANQMVNEVETAKRLILRGLPPSDAIARECKLIESGQIVRDMFRDWKPKEIS